MQTFYILLNVMFVAGIVAFLLYGFDKHRALCNGWRVPELVLLFVSLIGGAFGALCAMILFRHKTKHSLFLVCVPLFVIAHLTIAVLLRIGVL